MARSFRWIVEISLEREQLEAWCAGRLDLKLLVS